MQYCWHINFIISVLCGLSNKSVRFLLQKMPGAGGGRLSILPREEGVGQNQPTEQYKRLQ